MSLRSTAMAKVALNHIYVRMHAFLCFLTGQLAALPVACFSNEEKDLLARTVHAILDSEQLMPQMAD